MFNNAKQSIPRLFKEIIDCDNSLTEIVSSDPVDFKRYRLMKEIRISLSHAAAKFVSRKKTEST